MTTQRCIGTFGTFRQMCLDVPNTTIGTFGTHPYRGCADVPVWAAICHKRIAVHYTIRQTCAKMIRVQQVKLADPKARYHRL